MRRKKGSLTIPKRKTHSLSPEEYKEKFTRTVAQRQNSKLVKISKYYLCKAIEKIEKFGKKKKRRPDAIERYGKGGIKCLNVCNSVSMDAISPSLIPPISFVSNYSVLASNIRSAILTQKWAYCLRLYDKFLQCGGLRRRQLLYLMRLIFLILFNVGIPEEKLRNFLTVTMAIRSEEEKISFLQSLSELKKFPSKKFHQVRKKLRDEIEILETDDQSD